MEELSVPPEGHAVAKWEGLHSGESVPASTGGVNLASHPEKAPREGIEGHSLPLLASWVLQ